MKYIYIAGPYMGPARHHDWRDYSIIDRNIAQARDAFVALAQAGIGAFCPHLHSAHFEVIAPDVGPAYWYELDFRFLRACDALYLLPGWQESTGSLAEKAMAEFELHIPVFEDIDQAIAWAQGQQPVFEVPTIPAEEAVEQGIVPVPAPPAASSAMCVNCGPEGCSCGKALVACYCPRTFLYDQLPEHEPHLNGYDPRDQGNVLHLKRYVVNRDGSLTWLNYLGEANVGPY